MESQFPRMGKRRIMNAHIGEEGTEQFTLETRVDGRTVNVHPLHDPFLTSTTTVWLSRWDHFKAIFKKRIFTVQVKVRGTEGVQRAIMTLDPFKLQQETEAILEERRESRERHSRGDYSQDICSGRETDSR